MHVWCGALSLSCPAWCVLLSKDSGFAFPVSLGVVWEGGLGHVSTGGMKCHHEVSMFSMRKPCWCSAGRSPHFVCLTEFLQCFKEAVSSPVYMSSHTIIHAHAAVLKASPPTLDHPGTRAGSQAPSYQPLCFPEGGLRSSMGESLTSRSPWEELMVEEWERGSLKERQAGLATSAIAHQEVGNHEQGKEKM